MRVRPWLAIGLVAFVAPPQTRAADCDGDPTSETLERHDRFCSRITDTGSVEATRSCCPGNSDTRRGPTRKKKRDELEHDAWGAGYGRTMEDTNGETHTVCGFAFQDSHGNAQLQVGCSWSTFWGPRDGLQPGLGDTAMIVQRPDILDGVPFRPCCRSPRCATGRQRW